MTTKVTIGSVSRTGAAYFKVKSPAFKGGICNYSRDYCGLIHVQKDEGSCLEYPELDSINPLVERERLFDSVDEADAYVRAVTSVAMIRDLAIFGSIEPAGSRKRIEVQKVLERKQAEIRDKHMGILETIPAFEKAKPFLSMNVEEIVDALNVQSNLGII